MDKEIVRDLKLALSKVRIHVAAIHGKLDLYGRGAMMLWARQHGYFATGV